MDLKSHSEKAPTWSLTENLQFLLKKGLLVPLTHIVTIPATMSCVSERELSEYLESRLKQIVDPQRTYAVFSADPQEEDELICETFQLKSADNIADMKKRIAAIIKKEGFRTELVQDSTSSQSKEKTIIVMQVPRRQFGGLVFTKNPLNGLDETIVELVAKQQSAQELGYQQLVFQNGKAISRSESNARPHMKWLEEVISQATKIENAYGKPLCLEWVYDGQKIFWFQFKPLQNLEKLRIFSNKIAKEMLPGTIKPLVWSVNTSINSASWKRFIDRLIGKNSFDLREMTKQFYYRAYFNTGLFGDFFALFGMPRETLEIMMLGEAHSGKVNMPKINMNSRVARFIPRIIFLLIKNINLSKKTSEFIQNQKRQIESYDRDITKMDERETLSAIEDLFELNERCAYQVIVVRMIRSFHHTLIRAMLKRKGCDSKIEFSTDDLSDVDAKQSLAALKKKYDNLPQKTRDDLDAGYVPSFSKDYRSFLEDYRAFLGRFGHLSDSTADMSAPQWRENPALIMSLVKDAQRIPRKTTRATNELPGGVYGLILRRFLKNFVDFEKHSSRLGFLYTYGYSQFRPYFLHLGDLFIAKGFIEKSTDIFYLSMEEVVKTIESGKPEFQYSKAIAERKQEIEECKDVVLPEIIFGDDSPPIVRQGEASEHLEGLPSSTGYYEGPAKIVRGLTDLSKIALGDVLVIPYSDISWTPLFSKAGAVISESGGILSHCSIVAREYGIPAVVGVKGATSIPDNTTVLVDGYTGRILIRKFPKSSSS